MGQYFLFYLEGGLTVLTTMTAAIDRIKKKEKTDQIRNQIF